MIIERKNKFKLTWLIWFIVLCCVLIIGILIYSVYLYYSILNHKETGLQKSEQIILEQTKLISVDKVERFHGDTSYHVITGRAKDGDTYFAFLPITNNHKKQKITLINHANIISQSQIKDHWLKSCQTCHFIRISPGLIDDQPVWEITYKDQSLRYVFDYLSMYDGKSIEQFRFKRFSEK